MEPFGVGTLILCFGGGIVGAALGGLFSFILCGIIVLCGCMVLLQGGSDFLLLQVGLGPIFGPHVGGFAAGVAGATYAAAVKKSMPGGGKDILSPLMPQTWDVLLVGGIFAVIGHLIVQAFGKVPFVQDFDIIALSVATTAILCRLIFMKEMPWGNAASIKEKGFLKANLDLAWLPWTHPMPKMLLFGLGAGLFSTALAIGAQGAMQPLVDKGVVPAGTAFVVPLILGWAVGAVSLIALQLGTGAIQQVPVWHAQAILSAMAYLYFGSIGVVFVVAILTTLVQEFMARVFWYHGSNHIDPPACCIALGTFILNCIH